MNAFHLCGYHLGQKIELSITLEGSLLPLFRLLPPCLQGSLSLTFHWAIVVLDLDRIHVSEIKILCVASFAQRDLCEIPCVVTWFHSFLLLSSIPLIGIYHSLFSHSFIDR